MRRVSANEHASPTRPRPSSRHLACRPEAAPLSPSLPCNLQPRRSCSQCAGRYTPLPAPRPLAGQDYSWLPCPRPSQVRRFPLPSAKVERLILWSCGVAFIFFFCEGTEKLIYYHTFGGCCEVSLCMVWVQGWPHDGDHNTQ